ncbi:hypothetical protein [Streptomyces sp. CA-132043]|uniref:hypothetical protein n=1 Tax=Streptomyces sp. CA-132043 TaxID=3240048 RepID=UPI003D8B5BF3
MAAFRRGISLADDAYDAAAAPGTDHHPAPAYGSSAPYDQTGNGTAVSRPRGDDQNHGE